jgi:hypothetical protein
VPPVSFKNPKLNGAILVLISQVFASAMLLLLIYDITDYDFVGLQQHKD